MYQLIGIGLLAAAVVAFFNHYENIVGENKAAAQVISTCNANVSSLKQTIADQNQGAADVKKAEDARVKKAEDDAKVAKADADRHRALAQALLDAKPDPTMSACDATAKFLADYAKTRRK